MTKVTSELRIAYIDVKHGSQPFAVGGNGFRKIGFPELERDRH